MHHWRRDLIELAALFTAVAVADVVANLVGHGPDGPVLLAGSAAALVATAAFHTWWARRLGHPPSAPDTGAPPQTEGHPGSPPSATAGGDRADSTGGHLGEAPSGSETSDHHRADDDTEDGTSPEDGPPAQTVLWRLRTTVRDEPGSLAALCTALARLRVDILSLQAHPLAAGTVDEFLLRAPAELAARDISGRVAEVGGGDNWIERADTHDLVDAPTRVLALATRTALDPAELPLALRGLLGRCTIRSLPAPEPDPADGAGDSGHGGVPVEGVLEGTVLRLRAPEGGTITVERPYLPFTPAEFARARALVELDARLGPRVPRGHDLFTPPRGGAITVRRADTDDLAASRAMHERCSPATLRRRYHGPTDEADRYLDHLLSPRFGRTLAAQTASGRIVALGHLLWDGDETEVALLVEDDWQRRGIGGELLRRLVSMARDAGTERVYAVTQASNTAMVATMRGLGLPLDYQIEEGTLVVTARLGATPVGSRRPRGHVGEHHEHSARLHEE